MGIIVFILLYQLMIANCSVDDHTGLVSVSDDCSEYDINNLPHPRFILLGPTGVGKSSLANQLLGQNHYSGNEHIFNVGHGMVVHTTEISYVVGNWLGDGPCFTIVNTPGTSDAEGRDYMHALTLANVMKDQLKSVDIFLLCFNGEVARFDQSFIDYLKLVESVFSKEMWTHAITQVTFWSHDKRSVRRRKRNRLMNEVTRHKQWNAQYKQELNVTIEIPSVYIDPLLPMFDAEEVEWLEEREQQAFKKYTDDLFEYGKLQPPFLCDGNCQSPNGYFLGNPLIKVNNITKEQGEKTVISCNIWNGIQGEASDNVTWTHNGEVIYKKTTSEHGGESIITATDVWGSQAKFVERKSAGEGHYTFFSIEFEALVESMGGNYTCDNGQDTDTNFAQIFMTLDGIMGCSNGWFDVPNCKPCSCSSIGSKNETCNKKTGECYCKENYHGRSCSYNFDQNYGRNTRIAGPNDFIKIGSDQNSPGSWPWGVSIGWIDVDGSWQHFCSGVIVSPNKVLTTANCFKSLNDDESMGFDLTDIMITAGDTLLKSRRHDQHMQRRGFLKFKIHPGYVYDMHYLDIAVITLESPLQFNEYVKPVYLPSPIEAKKQVGMENVLLSISGWGKGGDGKGGEGLKDAVVTVFNNGYCISIYRGYRLDKLFTDEIFCGGNPVDLTEVCEGDDGSPAVLLDHKLGRYVLVGLLSMSNEFNEGYYDSPVCGTTKTPNIFIRLSSETIITFLHREIYGDLDPYLPKILTPHYDLECGRKTSNSSTDVGKWPWMVSLGTPHPDNPEEWLHFCGGSLVSATKVITAAHCTRQYNGNFTVRAGDGNLLDASDDDQVQTSLLESIDNHPEHRYRYFDIAVLTLEEPLKFTDAVRPVCLNTLESIGEKDEETSTHLVVSGWGDGTQMKETTVMIMSELMCNKTHELRRDNKRLVPNLFTDDVMCAADPAGESGTCQGDSGGPAVYFDTRKMRYHLRGVVGGSARGICGSYDFPNVYVRVESKSVLKWIQGIINK